MTATFNQPTVEFLVEAYLPGSKEPVDRFVIQQNEGGRKSKDRENRVYNSVQKHLSELSTKTGLDYHIVRWGDPGDRRAWMRGAPLNG